MQGFLCVDRHNTLILVMASANDYNQSIVLKGFNRNINIRRGVLWKKTKRVMVRIVS
jgi:hypothetical protein